MSTYVNFRVISLEVQYYGFYYIIVVPLGAGEERPTDTAGRKVRTAKRKGDQGNLVLLRAT
jgi:hypothetical protein